MTNLITLTVRNALSKDFKWESLSLDSTDLELISKKAKDLHSLESTWKNNPSEEQLMVYKLIQKICSIILNGSADKLIDHFFNRLDLLNQEKRFEVINCLQLTVSCYEENKKFDSQIFYIEQIAENGFLKLASFDYWNAI